MSETKQEKCGLEVWCFTIVSVTLIIMVAIANYKKGHYAGVKQEREKWTNWCLENEWAHIENGEPVFHDKKWINKFFNENYPELYKIFENPPENNKNDDFGV